MKTKGFTLIELMITVAIVAILLMVFVPGCAKKPDQPSSGISETVESSSVQENCTP